MADWVTISALATAGGTLVLAGATYGSVRSANRAARVAEQSLLTSLRPLLIPSKLEHPQQKIGFMEGKWVVAPGGGGVAEVGEDAVYLAISIRNAGSGIAVLHGWHVRGVAASALKGPKGNREFFLHLSKTGRTLQDLDGLIARTVTQESEC